MKEAFGEPGEWYLDKPTGTLRYMPKPGERPETVRVEAPVLPQLLIFQGFENQPIVNTELDGLVFRQSQWVAEGNFTPQGEMNIPTTNSSSAHAGITWCTSPPPSPSSAATPWASAPAHTRTRSTTA